MRFNHHLRLRATRHPLLGRLTGCVVRKYDQRAIQQGGLANQVPSSGGTERVGLRYEANRGHTQE